MNGLRRISNGHQAFVRELRPGIWNRSTATVWSWKTIQSSCATNFPFVKHALTCEKVIGGQCLTKWLRHGAQAALSCKTLIYFILYPSSSVMYTCLIHVSAFSVRYYYKSENVGTRRNPSIQELKQEDIKFEFSLSTSELVPYLKTK